MTVAWTSEQVLSLSPDAGSTKRGKALAIASKWPLLGCAHSVVWGECKGSGQKPYRTAVDLGVVGGEPAFRCSCPSRKFPCKHALGLLLLLAEQGGFANSMLPDWVAEWVEKRSHLATQKQEKKTKSAVAPALKAEQIAKKLEKRSRKVEAGLADLDQWLQDIVRQGLANLQTQPYSFWDQTAARLVDAQAPGLANRVRSLAGIPHSGQGWPERMLKALGKLHLLVQGYGNIDTLEAALQAEVRSQIGFPQTKNDLIHRAEHNDPQVQNLSDTWKVLGKFVSEEESLKMQRVWLWGTQCEKPAMVLSFAHGRRQPLDTSLMPGTTFEGTLIFYPGTGVQRAFVAERKATAKWTDEAIGFETVDSAIAQYAKALTANPWLGQFPLVLNQSYIRHHNQQWWLQDGTGDVLPIAPPFSQGWELLAMGGGRPLTVFGEWAGEHFLPLSVWSAKKFVTLGGKS
ncbi:MAG: SWIM zinc finger family protein [Cyanobacteria bacterium P01_A01_bin.116]